MRALKDVWIIGDHLVRHAYPYLQQYQEDYEKSGEFNYLHYTYDVYGYYPDFTENNILTMVRSTLVEAMNKRTKLPSTIIILLSEKFITQDPLYLPSELDGKLKWILRECSTAIKIRKSSLPPKTYSFGEPRIMLVRAFQNSLANKINPNNLQKFNNMLMRTCMAKAVYTLPVPSFENADTRCFDYDQKTHIIPGFQLLWNDIIEGLQAHDELDEKYRKNSIIKEYLKKEEKPNDNKESDNSRDNYGVNVSKNPLRTAPRHHSSYHHDSGTGDNRHKDYHRNECHSRDRHRTDRHSTQSRHRHSSSDRHRSHSRNRRH